MHIQKQLEKVLEDAGITEIKTVAGDEFNPQLHEAIENQETQNMNQETQNKIKKIIARGYKIGGKVIRPARVVVE